MRKAFAHIPRTTLLAGIMLMALASCKPKRPAGVLSPSQMENLLVDYHLAQGMAEAESNGRNTDELRYIYIHAALKTVLPEDYNGDGTKHVEWISTKYKLIKKQ